MSLLLLGAGNSGGAAGAAGPLFRFRAGDTPQGMLFAAPTSGALGGVLGAPVRMYIGDQTATPRSTYAGWSSMTGATWNLLVFGDSISRPYTGNPLTVGATIGDGYPAKVARYHRTSKFNWGDFARDAACLANGGDTTLDIPSIVSATIPSAFSSLPTIAIVFAGTNDITNLGQTAATTYTRLKTVCALIKSSYATNKVIVPTMAPRGSGNESIRTTYNSSINGGDTSYDYVANVGADATIGTLASNSDATLYPDGVHWSDLSHTYAFPLVNAKVILAKTALGVT